MAEESGERFVADRFARLAWSAPVSIASVPQSPLNRLHDAHGVIYKWSRTRREEKGEERRERKEAEGN